MLYTHDFVCEVSQMPQSSNAVSMVTQAVEARDREEMTMSQLGDAGHRVSVVIPMYNEEANTLALVASVHDGLKAMGYPWELILVDDGSSDGTVRLLREAAREHGAHVRILEFHRNYGQTAAMQAGIDAARGDIIVLMDGDLQNDPTDIPRMVERLLAEDLDVVAGWRKNRQDDYWKRKFPSRIANWLIGRVTGVVLHDYGCSLKVFRGDILKRIRLYGEMHRFIPAWAGLYTSPSRIREEVVAHHPRRFGVSKYGLSRTSRVLLDLIAVHFFMRYRARPGHFFGMAGLVVGGIGALLLTYLAGLKMFTGASIGDRPLLLLGVLLVLVATQFVTTGVLSEMLSRTYFEAANVSPHSIRPESPGLVTGGEDWKVG